MAGDITTNSILNTPIIVDPATTYTGGAEGQFLALNAGKEVVPVAAPGGSGTVTSVAVSGSDGIEVDSGSPITASGTIALGVNAATLRSHINVEAGATADQSNAEIEAAYNAQVAVVAQATAEAGTSTTVVRWTPERVAQAIRALGRPALVAESGTSRTNQVGDAWNTVEFTNTSAKAYTLDDAVQARGDRIEVLNAAVSGDLAITAGTATVTGNLTFGPGEGGVIIFTGSAAAIVVGGAA
jgi:hypothetical protein